MTVNREGHRFESGLDNMFIYGIIIVFAIASIAVAWQEYSEKQLIDFGNYILDDGGLESDVTHADRLNWQESIKKF